MRRATAADAIADELGELARRPRMAIDPQILDGSAGGDEVAVLRGVAASAILWANLAGFDLRRDPVPSAAQCLADSSARGGLLAAAVDLVQLLRLSPQGREALAHFGCRPALEQS